MQKLKEAHLFRGQLIPIGGKMVERYNDCLKTLGFEPTNLVAFSIDGLGWSPEIAEERDNLYYLNHGEANSHGIIVSPLQKGAPVYMPNHSFDRELMKLIFKTYSDQITDITRDSAICLDFDQGIDAFYEPLDMLRYREVIVRFKLIHGIGKAQQEQFQLIEKFKSGNNFIDEKIHAQLLDSAKKYGDLRHRNLDLPELKYDVSSYFSRAFGGVYVLKDFIKDMIIFEDETMFKKAIDDTSYDILMFHIDHDELVEKLRDHLIAECHLDQVVQTPRYERIKKFEFHQELKNGSHPIKEILEDKILFKSYLNKIELNSLKKINGVEIYLERLQRSNQYKLEDMVDLDFYHALHQPHSSLEPIHQDLIWKLLVNISPKDVLFLFWYDKEQFYKAYQTWDDSFQDWVIEQIRNNI